MSKGYEQRLSLTFVGSSDKVPGTLDFRDPSGAAHLARLAEASVGGKAVRPLEAMVPGLAYDVTATVEGVIKAVQVGDNSFHSTHPMFR
jgi:hypothetical protein